MPTLTATAMANSPRAVHAGLNSVTVEYNSGATEIEVSATHILLCKLPNGAKVVDFTENHSTGAATCPVDYGVTGDSDAFATALTQGVVARATAGVPYTVALADDAALQYTIFRAVATPGTATASLKINTTIFYTVGE